MKKWNFWTIIIIQLFYSIVNDISNLAFNSSIELLLFDKECVYTTQNKENIFKRNIEDDTELPMIKETLKQKTLIKLTDDTFIVFALNENQLVYSIFNINNINEQIPISPSFKNLSIKMENNYLNYTIRSINENNYILYYNIYRLNLTLFSFQLNSSNIKGGYNFLEIEEMKDNKNEYFLNYIECDSYDGENIFCVYSIIKTSYSEADDQFSYETTSFSSFENIVKGKLSNNIIKKGICNPSILKIEHNNKKKFLMCFYELKDKASIFCQYFTQNGNKLDEEQIFVIGNTQYYKLNYEHFPFKKVISLFHYEYSIYVLLKFDSDKDIIISSLYVTSIDLDISLPVYLNNDEKYNIYVNDKYIIFLIDNKFELNKLQNNCPKNNTFFFPENNADINLNEFVNINMNPTYITFSLDPLTKLYVDEIRNMGGILYKQLLKDGSSTTSIKVEYNENLKITQNYFIYHGASKGQSESTYVPYSNYCYFKLVNCYESCRTCNANIEGNNEVHQCIRCKNNYFEYNLNLNEEGCVNCYKIDDPKVEEYFLGNDGRYYPCHKSCKKCKDNTSCIECKELYYFKEDKLNDICYDNTPIGYYFENSTYKKCYETCSTCFAGGDIKLNNCIECKSNYTKFPYDQNKCTENYLNCKSYWRLNSTNNIECIENCNNFIIHEGINKNQCVEKCQSYINPLSSQTGQTYLFYTCDEQRYCITPEFCQLKNLKSNLTTCFSNGECFNMSDTSLITQIPEEKPDQIDNKVTMVKYFEFNNIKYSDISSNFSSNQSKRYRLELQLESETYKDIYINGIYLITINIYEDFTLTIYPLVKEKYLYENIIKTNKLGFVHFSEYWNEDILIGLIEFHNINYPINTINYFFYYYNEDYNTDYKEITKNELSNLIGIKVEYPIHNYNNPDIIEDYSLFLIDTIKTLYSQDIDITLSKETEDEAFFTDICTTFTSDVGTDMTLADRTNLYFTKLSLCENGCEMITLIDKGLSENPRAVCDCKLKQKEGFSDDDYTFNYEKKEGKDVLSITVLKCGKKVLSGKEIQDNFIFWIFLFIIFILFVIFLIVLICGKSSIENVLKIKQEVQESEESQSNANISNISEKNSNRYSEGKDQSLEIKLKNNSRSKDIISPKNSSKLSDSNPPKRKKEIISTKGENNLASRTENSINTTINYNNKIEFKFKEKDDNYDEIFPDYNEILNNNYYEGNYLKNNYVNLRMQHLDLKKNFLLPLTKDDIPRYINTDNEDYFDDIYSYRKKKNIFNYFKTLLPDADLSEDVLDDNIKRKKYKSENDMDNKKYFLKKSIRFFEDSNFLGDDQLFPYEDNNKTISLKNKNKKKITIKKSKDLNNDILLLNKKKKSLISNNSDEKKSNSSSRSLAKKSDLKDSKNSLLDNYFLNSSNNNINFTKIKYSFIKFYWIYLNRKEFCLASIYNMEDNVAYFIRLSTFLFVIFLILTINTLFLTTSQIHQRYIYTKKNGTINEFTYVFTKEAASCFCCTIIYLIIKMLFIKFIYGKLFRISYSAKEDLTPFGALNSEKESNGEKNMKRQLYLKKYQKISLIYISILFVVMFLLGYITICYFGIFKNTKPGIIVRFFISFIFSIIFCAFICLIIVTIFHFGRKYNNKILKLTYKWANIIY